MDVDDNPSSRDDGGGDSNGDGNSDDCGRAGHEMDFQCCLVDKYACINIGRE